MSNQPYYRYTHIELWEEASGQNRRSAIGSLVQTLQESYLPDDAPYGAPYQGLIGEEARSMPFYD